MRRTFVKYLESKIEQDPSIVLITADLGYGLFDNIQEKYTNNFINCGAAEELMIGLCVGAAYEGKKPIAYSITPFLIYRPFVLIRNYVDKEKLNIKLIASGRDTDYSHDGFSHWAVEDKDVMLNSFKNIKSCWPEMSNITQTLDEAFNSADPYYINLKR